MSYTETPPSRNTTKTNLVLGILNPRNISTVMQNFENNINNVDKVYIKYYNPEQQAYEALRDFFLDHTEFSHLCLIADDCIINPEHIDRLRWGVHKHDFPVLTGFGNVNLTDKKDVYTISFEGVPIKRNERGDSFHTLIRHKEMFSEMFQTCAFGEYFKVKWCGFGLTVIRRDIVERIPFEDDARWNGQPYLTGCCIDTAFSHVCNENNIPIWVEPHVKVHHLKLTDLSLMQDFYAGVLPRSIKFESRIR